MDHAEVVRQGVTVCNAAGVFNRSVAACAVGLLICLMRNIHLGNKEVHACDWSRFMESRNGERLYDKTVGLVGFGGIAQTVAKMLFGFDCHVIACDPYFNDGAAAKYNVRRMDMDFLKKTECNAVLINTSSGTFINEDDLAEMLKTGAIAGAGLDVLRQEPVVPKCPLPGLENCILEPHIGANTNDAVMNAGMFAPAASWISSRAGRSKPS